MIKLRPSIEVVRHCCRDHVSGAEIGVLGGGHAVTMLSNFPQLERLHLIDSYGGMTDKDPKFLDFKERFESYSHRILWHICTSLVAAGSFKDESLDFVYIDANHRYFEVAQDIRAWWPKVKPTGILCGHDYFTFGSVVKAVDDWAKENNHYIFSTNPDWWCFKE
jgi:predicted O-methyltransferase YrrM